MITRYRPAFDSHVIEFPGKVIAHRGCSGYAPENTLAAFRMAEDMGVAWLEADVTLCRDHQALIFHDETMDRCSNLSGNLAELDWAQIKDADTGSWFAPGFADQRPLTLKQFAEWSRRSAICINLELKVHSGLPWQPLVEQVAAMQWNPGQLLISSFHMPALAAFTQLRPDIPAGLLFEEYQPGWQQWAEQIQAVSIHCDLQAMTPLWREEIYDQQLQLLFYTVNTAEDYSDAFSWQPDAVFSDCPDIFMD